MHHDPTRRFHPGRQRPPWWPQDEPWPPTGPAWRGGRRRLFFRFGCLFAVMVFTGLIVFSLLVILFANALGVIEISRPLGWILPIGGGVLLGGAILFGWAGRGLRRISQPVGDLVEAAEGIAEGDYTRRVAERGPREIRSVLRTFNHMAERLEISIEQRRDFMADVTHELRTPLTVIQGNLEGMLDGVYPADENHLRATLEETQLLGRLVEDLRTLSLAESKALELRKEPADLALLVEECAAAFRPQADAQGVRLSVETAVESAVLELDGERMRQVLSNLVSNALRYTPSGGLITLRCTTLSDKSASWAQVEVVDSGQGIQVQDLEHIFERFYKGSDSRGMGLGLSIARTLVEAHGGTITAASQPGQGTVFTVRLPVVQQL